MLGPGITSRLGIEFCCNPGCLRVVLGGQHGANLQELIGLLAGELVGVADGL
ncbi:hypothetical protein SF660363_3017 [Shigella flexneri 6603-63]|uniref:hypothetical protein n=1 Tax=Shigella sonnei TaxID=624 RepID=UPI00026E3BDC|nr:hypothetical protein SF660363_3017 [Shigella flexneri 6603-63]